MPVIPLVPSDSPTLISSLLRLSTHHLVLAISALQPLKSVTLSLYLSIPAPVLIPSVIISRPTTAIRPSSPLIPSLPVPSVLWRCWLGGRKGIRPVKNWVVGCWRGYLSGARCRLTYGPADATATHCLLLQWNPDWFYLSGTGSPR